MVLGARVGSVLRVMGGGMTGSSRVSRGERLIVSGGTVGGGWLRMLRLPKMARKAAEKPRCAMTGKEKGRTKGPGGFGKERGRWGRIEDTGRRGVWAVERLWETRGRLARFVSRGGVTRGVWKRKRAADEEVGGGKFTFF